MINVQAWDRFVHSTPGRRFQERYRRMREQKGSAWKRGLFVIAGVALAAIGVCFLVVPGPGIPILAVGMALVAQESVTLARLLDRAELKLRRIWKRWRQR
jgi:hypothetical protein